MPRLGGGAKSRNPGGGLNIEKFRVECGPVLKRMGLFVLSQMNDIAICDVK